VGFWRSANGVELVGFWRSANGVELEFLAKNFWRSHGISSVHMEFRDIIGAPTQGISVWSI